MDITGQLDPRAQHRQSTVSDTVSKEQQHQTPAQVGRVVLCLAQKGRIRRHKRLPRRRASKHSGKEGGEEGLENRLRQRDGNEKLVE